MKKFEWTAGLIAIAVVGAACGSSSTTKASSAIPAGPIKVGAIYSLSGNYKLYAASEQAVGAATIAQINADGGIAGHQVQLVIEDDKSSPDGAVAAAQKLIDDKVAAFVAIGVSPQPLQAAPVIDKAQIPAIALLTDETFEDGKKWPYIFNNYSDAKSGVAPYPGFLKNIGKSSVVMISDTTPASTAFGQHLKEVMTAGGIKVLQEASFDPTAVDLTTEVQKLKAAAADTLIAANVVGFGALYNALRAVNWKPTIVETTAAYYDNSASLGDLTATTFAGCNVGLKAGSQFPDKVTAVLKAEKDKLGTSQPDAIVSVLSAYDALLQLKWAIEKVGSLDGTKIAKQLETIKDMGFSNPDWKYTFSATMHQGWPGTSNHICTVTPLDTYGTPQLAAKTP